MLILSRAPGQDIIINDNIRVTVVGVEQGRNGNQPKVRIGIQAPTDVPVDRREVYEAKKREGRKCALK